MVENGEKETTGAGGRTITEIGQAFSKIVFCIIFYFLSGQIR